MAGALVGEHEAPGPSPAAPRCTPRPPCLTALMGKVVAALSLKAVRYRLSPRLHKKRENNKSDARVGGGSYNAKLFWFL